MRTEGPLQRALSPSTDMNTKLLVALAAPVGVGFVALFRGVFARPPSTPASALAGSQSVQDFKAGFSLGGSTVSLVAQLQSQLAVNEKDEHSWVLLGLAYQQRARETGDPNYYAKSAG